MRQLESGCIPGRCVFFVLVLLIAFCICPPEPTLQLFSKKKYNEKSKFKNDEYMFTCTTTGSVTSRPVFQKEMFSYLCLIHHHHSCWPNYLSQFLLHYRVPENTNRKIIFVRQIVWIPYNIAHCTKHSRKKSTRPSLTLSKSSLNGIYPKSCCSWMLSSMGLMGVVILGDRGPTTHHQNINGHIQHLSILQETRDLLIKSFQSLQFVF